MFLHAGVFHIAFNAYALWIFGSVVEQELGRLRFTLIYFVTGLAAGAVSYAFGPIGVGVGASGAIFGVFGAFVAYNWRRRDLALAAARLRSAMFIIVVNMLLAFTIPGIDWRAHMGGLGAGLLAGFAAEGAGSPAARRAILVGGFLALAGLTVALVAWRNEDLRSSIPFFT
jgi:membrane associated rhomboid family serine protease